MDDYSSVVQAEYIAIKALENGVTIIGLTRGKDTRFHHTEKLDKGEVMIAQFTENTSAIKVRGKAEIYTRHGVINHYIRVDLLITKKEYFGNCRIKIYLRGFWRGDQNQCGQ